VPANRAGSHHQHCGCNQLWQVACEFVAASRSLDRHGFTAADARDGDGLHDIIVHFETEDLVLGTSDVQGVVEGKTLDGRTFRGTDLVKVIK
jgi:hypothetical protein